MKGSWFGKAACAVVALPAPNASAKAAPATRRVERLGLRFIRSWLRILRESRRHAFRDSSRRISLGRVATRPDATVPCLVRVQLRDGPVRVFAGRRLHHSSGGGGKSYRYFGSPGAAVRALTPRRGYL